MKSVSQNLKIILLFFIMGTSSAFSTTFMNRPLNDVIKDAVIIARGTAGSAVASWDKDHKQVYTYTDFNVTEVLKGDLNESRIRLRQPGGAVDDIEMAVPGVAHFASGEEAVVLLSPKNKEDDSYDVPGFTTGKYNVVTKENGEVFLVNSLGGGAVYDPDQGSHALSYNSTIPLDEFRKLASGEKTADVKQYEPANRPPTKQTQQPQSHSIQNSTIQPSAQSMMPKEVVQTKSKGRFGIPASLMAVILLTVVGVWGIFRKWLS